MLPQNLSYTAATSQDGPSLEFIVPIADSAIFRMQVAEGCACAVFILGNIVDYIANLAVFTQPAS